MLSCGFSGPFKFACVGPALDGQHDARVAQVGTGIGFREVTSTKSSALDGQHGARLAQAGSASLLPNIDVESGAQAMHLQPTGPCAGSVPRVTCAVTATLHSKLERLCGSARRWRRAWVCSCVPVVSSE